MGHIIQWKCMRNSVLKQQRSSTVSTVWWKGTFLASKLLSSEKREFPCGRKWHTERERNDSLDNNFSSSTRQKPIGPGRMMDCIPTFRNTFLPLHAVDNNDAANWLHSSVAAMTGKLYCKVTPLQYELPISSWIYFRKTAKFDLIFVGNSAQIKYLILSINK